MKKSTKASLLSLLIFPGAGHLYLKKHALGLVLAIGATVASYFIISSVVQTALEVSTKIQNGSIPLEAATIVELVSQRSRDSEGTTSVAVMTLLVFWVVGILDSFRVGRMLENSDSVANQAET